MELVTTLKGQRVWNAIREVGINGNHWYPVGWGNQLKPGSLKPVIVWQQAIVVYRDSKGQLHAVEDACPHRGVALHKGRVVGEHLACAYHGWEFNGEGQCAHIPYLPKEQKLPCAEVRSYPVQEKYDLIWIFPGEATLADSCLPPDIPEFDQSDWLMVPIVAHMKAHFSICNENAMDVFHGFLHEDLQGWFDPVLLSLRENDTSVCAQYKVSYKGRMAQFLGLSERADEVTTLPISIEYHYPHFHTSLQGISSLYLMRLPVGLRETRSWAFFFFKVRLPRWILRLLKPTLQVLIERFLLRRFLAQDIEMMESEQQNYVTNSQRRYVEINPAIIALQRLTVRQYERFVQQSSQLQNIRNRDSEELVSLSMKMVSNQAEPTQESSIG